MLSVQEPEAEESPAEDPASVVDKLVQRLNFPNKYRYPKQGFAKIFAQFDEMKYPKARIGMEFKGLDTLIVYTDFSADSIFALNAMIESRIGHLARAPIIIFTSAKDDDSFGEKLTMAAATMGMDCLVNLYVVGGDDEEAHEPYDFESNSDVLRTVAIDIIGGASHVTGTIEWFFLAPGKGNIASLVSHIMTSSGDIDDITQRSKISIYGGESNLKRCVVLWRCGKVY